MASVKLTGFSGRIYEYAAHPPLSDWNPLPINYAFAGLNRQGIWFVPYIGQTASGKSRLPPCHDRWAEAARLGATVVLARVNQDGEAARLAEERDLIFAYRPTLNTQHNPYGSAALLAGLLGRAQ